MTRSLDFTACIKQDECPVKDCWRKLTNEEKDWLEKTPNRMYYADFSSECEKLKEIKVDHFSQEGKKVGGK